MLKEIFDEKSTLSSMRLASIGSVVLFIPVFVFAWGYISIRAGSLVDIPDGVAGFLSVLLGAKVIQKAIEVAGGILQK